MAVMARERKVRTVRNKEERSHSPPLDYVQKNNTGAGKARNNRHVSPWDCEDINARRRLDLFVTLFMWGTHLLVFVFGVILGALAF